MSSVLQRLVYARGFAVALAFALLSGCAVTTGAGQSRLATQENFAASYTVCAGVQASRLRERKQGEHVCRRSEGVRVIL